jgi:F-type H+-transporting ATPase subunit epsilon
MANHFSLEILTPEKLFYCGDAELVIVKTLTGEEGFMARHTWACKLLDTGELWFREAGGKDYKLAAISGGFIDVKDKIHVYTDAAEWPDEILVDRAEEAVQRVEQWLEHNKDADQESLAGQKEAMRRARNRLNVAKGGVRPRNK